MQLNHVLKNRPYESDKTKLDIVEVMLDGNLLESLKLWRKIKSEKEKEYTFKKKDTGDEYKKRYVKENSGEKFQYCLGKVRNRFIKNLNARRQRAYMRAGIINPKSLSIDAMSFRHFKRLSC